MLENNVVEKLAQGKCSSQEMLQAVMKTLWTKSQMKDAKVVDH